MLFGGRRSAAVRSREQERRWATARRTDPIGCLAATVLALTERDLRIRSPRSARAPPWKARDACRIDTGRRYSCGTSAARLRDNTGAHQMHRRSARVIVARRRHALILKLARSAALSSPSNSQHSPSLRLKLITAPPRSSTPPTMPGATTTLDAPIVVAYTCNPRKRQFFDKLADEAASIPGLVFVDHAAVKGAHYDALLHKRTDDFVGALTGDVDSFSRLREFRRMLPDHVVPVDNLAGIPKLIDRAEMARAIETAVQRAPSPARAALRNLRCAVVRADAPRSSLVKTFSAFEFPVIIKRRLACGTPESHEMAIAYDLQAAVDGARTLLRDSRCKSDSFSRSLFVQEFVPDHGALLFKLYSIGERVFVQTRVSVQVQQPASEDRWCTFDSQVMSKGARRADVSAPNMPDDLARMVAKTMRSEIDLSLFGVDLIYCMRSQRYCIVDVNYFPTFKGVQNANRLVLLHAMEKVQERRLQRAASTMFRAPTVDWTRIAAAAACADWAGADASRHAVAHHDGRHAY